MDSSKILLGIDIGGTRIKAVALKQDGQILGQRIEPSIDDVESLLKTVTKLIDGFAAGDPSVGISAPGIVSPDNRSIAWMRGRMQAVEGLDWGQRLERNIWVLNDAHAATTAEAWIGAARGISHALMLTLGTGVGGGIIINGKLFPGATGRAGHLGHITLDWEGSPDIVSMPGSLEDCIGDHNVYHRSGSRYRNTRELMEAMESGNEQAVACWRRSVRGLAVGIASLVNAFDPEIVVLGGGIAECRAALFDLLKTYMDEVEWRPMGPHVPIVPAQLGEFAGAIGAARFAALQNDENHVRERCQT